MSCFGGVGWGCLRLFVNMSINMANKLIKVPLDGHFGYICYATIAIATYSVYFRCL